MIGSEVSRAVTAARSIASALGLRVDDAIVLHNSNKLTLRLRPCDIVARVAPVAQQALEFEIAIARRLAESESPVAALDPRVEPRVHLRDGFAVTLWTYYEPVGTPVPAADYADALRRLHAGMRAVDIEAPLATDRVASAQRIVASRDLSPALAEADRTLLADTLSRLGGVVGARTDVQLLHGEPHPGNVVATERGLVFVDLETCCRGPVEFDLAHAPDAVAEHYPGVDRDLLRDCRVLMLAMITAWRWDPDDQLPSGRQLAAEWLGQIKAARARPDQETLG
ncbi:MAG TPA: phosphotransferase [Microlunatus sp.]|nr:phosphotransferase [Microlunatus sp.]